MTPLGPCAFRLLLEIDICTALYRRYQTVTNWFQNMRSVAKKRMEELDDAQSVHSSAHSDYGSTGHRAEPPSARPPFPAAASHPSLSSSINNVPSAPTPQPPTLIIPLRHTRPTSIRLRTSAVQIQRTQQLLRCLHDRVGLVPSRSSWRRSENCSPGRRTRRLKSGARLRWRSICASRISFHICSKKRSFAN